MEKLYIDAGTTWTKILKIENEKKTYTIEKTSDFKKKDADYTKCTGHSLIKKQGIYENEVVALSKGAQKYLEDDFVVLDLGSRDIKYIKFENKKFKDLDWNCSCASATGATIEMLLKFYETDIKDLVFTKEKYAVTCGIFGLERIMDDVANGLKPNIAISKFVHGIAYNAFNFVKGAPKICLSGGFCENPCFIESLEQYSTVIPLGRFILTEGLYEIDKESYLCSKSTIE